jgi:hypothetical protein
MLNLVGILEYLCRRGSNREAGFINGGLVVNFIAFHPYQFDFSFYPNRRYLSIPVRMRISKYFDRGIKPGNPLFHVPINRKSKETIIYFLLIFFPFSPVSAILPGNNRLILEKANIPPTFNCSLYRPAALNKRRQLFLFLATKDTKNENYKLQITSYKQITNPKLQITNPSNYKLQITNYKQITNPKLQITNPSLETEYKDYNGERSQLTIGSWQPENRLAFNFLSIQIFLLSTGPGEAPSPGPARHHAQLIRTSSKFNKLRNVFSDREKNFCIISEYRDVSGPGFISLKKYPGPRTHGFLFLTAKAREETRREENYKLQTLLWKRNTKTIMGHEVNLQAVVVKMKINGGTQEGEESVKVNHEWEW